MNHPAQDLSRASAGPGKTPTITRMQVIPIAGTDGMLLNLSGAHGPFFTRNLVLLTDSAGCTGVGEVPGGEKSAGRWRTHAPWCRVNRLGAGPVS